VAGAAVGDQHAEDVLRALYLSDPDCMENGDDFSAFLSKTVPERIRLRGLRRLWTANPVLANLDGLIDYGEDFTNAATVMENLQTAYRVGQGMAKHVEEMARQAAAQDESVAEDATKDVEAADSALAANDAGESEYTNDSSQESESAEIAKPDQNSQTESVQLHAKSDDIPPKSDTLDEGLTSKPRRMRYRFDD